MSSVSEEKLKSVDEAVKLLKEYEIIGAADLYKISSNMLQDLRKQLRDQVTLRCVKNTLIRKAMENAALPNVEEFLYMVPGSNIFFFSNGNPFKLAMMLHHNKVKVFAKAGDEALDNIVIPSGNTGLSPGPILSKFGGLGVRTRIEAGNIWVVNDTEVAKQGDKISQDLADILTRMGIRAAEMGLEVKAVYEGGAVILGKELILDLQAYKHQLEKAYAEAFHVALKSAFPTTQTLTTLIGMVDQNARRVASEAGYATPENVKELIAKAQIQAVTLDRVISGK